MSEFSGGEFDDSLVGTGEQLLAHLEQRVATPDDIFSTNDFRFFANLTRELADRIGEGVVPSGFVIATEYLIIDCQSGTNGLGEPMPKGIIGYPPVGYRLYRLWATELARGAYGDEFAEQVEALRAEAAANHPPTA